MEKKKILIVEDEGIVAADIKESLQNLGYEVSAVVSSGAEALKEVKDKKPDLVLMDIVLQGEMNGIDTASRIRLSPFDIPVVYLTAYADQETLERVKITEPFGYIIKPFEERELYTIIEMALYKHGMEKKLKDSEKWLSTTLKSIGDAVIATDSKGHVKFMNPVAQYLCGWKEDEAAGRPLKEVFNIINEETEQEVESPVTKALREGVVVGLANHTLLISKDGTKRAIDDSGAPIRDSDGNIIGVVLVFRDITEKKKTEEELTKTKKLESLGILAGGIAHDFNNLLTAILCNIYIVKRNFTEEDTAFGRLEDAAKASLRASDLAQQLLTFSKGGAPIKTTVSIIELVEESAKFILSGSQVKCEFSFPDDLWSVEIDKAQISQVINNLIINADQSMPGGGTINVSIANVSVDKKERLPLKYKNYLKITITDHGIGISKEHLSRIFDPYFTTKQKGSGLGLAISYSIIKKHEGLITAKSSLGEGTTFYIYLPALTKPAQKKKIAEDGPIAGKGKILIMDDEEIIRNVVKDHLSDIGYEVKSAKDGMETIKMYKKAIETGQSFDAVIMDLTIPGGMGGKETIEKLIKIDPDVKAVVSSGYFNDPIMADFQKYGFSGFIAKPYRIREMSKVLHRILK